MSSRSSTTESSSDDDPEEELAGPGAPPEDLAAAYSANRDMLRRMAAADLLPFGLQANAEDVVQQAVLGLLQSPPADVRSWQALLVHAVRWRAKDVIQRAESRHAGPGAVELSERPDIANDDDLEAEVADAAELDQLQMDVRSAMADAGLSDMERKVLEHLYDQEETQVQAAKALGKSTGRISQLKKSGLAKVQAVLEARGVDW